MNNNLMENNVITLQTIRRIVGKKLDRLGRISVAVLAILISSSVFAKPPVNLNNLEYSKLPGGVVQINLTTDGSVGTPGSFITAKPARIALDFFGMKAQLAKKMVKVNAGKVSSVVAVETDDRTRLVINLLSNAQYVVNEIDTGYAITVYNKDTDISTKTAPSPFAKGTDILPDTKVNNVDFRRSKAGGGSLIIDLSADDVVVDTRERDGEIIVDVFSTSLPKKLERRLDVTDFATPVQTVDAFQNSDNVRFVIVPKGKYQHLAFQSGNQYVLDIDPIVETKKDKQNKEDALLGYTGERLSINFQKIEVRSALAVIADFTGINFVTSDSVVGEITINLKDVPWDQALDVILRAKGLSQRKSGNVIWVAPSQEIAEIEQNQREAEAAAEESAPLSSELIQINYAKAADIADVIKSVKVVRQGNVSSSSSLNTVLGSSLNVTETDKNSLLTSRGSVTVDERTNSLLVQDVTSKIKELRKVIAKLDRPVRQVLIETRIVEANDSFSRELGARLGFQRITENAQFPGASGSNIGNVIGSGTTEGVRTLSDSFYDPDNEDGTLIFDTSRGVPGGLAVDLGADGIAGESAASYAFDIFRTGRGFANLITLELSALEADGRGQIVASPRLVTASQKEASISQGREIYVAIPGGGLGGAGRLEKIEAELKLKVTPQITPDDRVVLDVEINQDVLIDTNTVGTKQIQTQVLANNGETIVIGGIYQEEETSGETKVPFLGDIPILGNLFKKRSKRSDRTELLIFLTPKIISPKLNLG